MDQNLQTASNVSGLGMDKPQAGGSHEKKVGPIIASLIVVLVLIIAALYVFASKINQPIIPDDDSTSGATAETEVKPVTNTSTDVSAMQKDLDTSTQGLDSQNF